MVTTGQMKSDILIINTLLFAVVALFLTTQFSLAITDARKVKNVGINENLGQIVPSDIELLDGDNTRVQLGDYLGDKPLVLNLAYYNCPRICSLGTDGLAEVVNSTPTLSAGEDYNLLTVSFDPEDTPQDAKSRASKYKLSEDDMDWSFLVGNSAEIKRLTSALGFNYMKDGEEFAHPSAIFVLTPDGEISRYLYGIEYSPTDFKLALVEASEGEIGPSKIMNQVLLFCYGFDPIGKRYALKALNVVKAAGVVTLISLGGFLTFFWRREKNDSDSYGGSKD